MRKLLSDPMVPSSPEWRVITPTTLQKHDTYDSYRICIGLGSEMATKINRENDSHGQKNQGLSNPEFHSSA